MPDGFAVDGCSKPGFVHDGARIAQRGHRRRDRGDGGEHRADRRHIAGVAQHLPASVSSMMMDRFAACLRKCLE